MAIETLNNGESKQSFRNKLNNMFAEIYNRIFSLKTTDLGDMPSDLSAAAGKVIKVNSSGTGYEFVTGLTHSIVYVDDNLNNPYQLVFVDGILINSIEI